MTARAVSPPCSGRASNQSRSLAIYGHDRQRLSGVNRHDTTRNPDRSYSNDVASALAASSLTVQTLGRPLPVQPGCTAKVCVEREP